MSRVFVHIDGKNYFQLGDGSVVEEHVRYRWRRFRRDQSPLERVPVQVEIPVHDPLLIERVRAEALRLQFLGRALTPAPKQLPRAVATVNEPI